MRSLLWILLASVALVAPAHAQPAEAIGKPLPAADLRDGTITLRLIAGDPGKPVNGAEVTLMATPPDGTSPPSVRRARTDSDGRVTFTDVAADAMVQLKAPGEDGEVTSSTFPMPTTGGVRVMLSTLPFGGGKMGPAGPMAGGPPMAGGAGGPPMSPRAMSGQARPEQGDAPDTLTVRLSYDDFADPSPPKDQPVLLVGYRFDLAIAGTMVKSDASGRAVFTGLDKRGATSYFALTLLPRGNDVDRLASGPIQLPGAAGVRLMLSGDKRTATTGPIDDEGTGDPATKLAVPAGEVLAVLSGLVQAGDPVELVDALTGKVVATTKAIAPGPSRESLTATWAEAKDDPALAVGALMVAIDENGARGAGATVEVRAATPAAAPATTPPAAEARWTATADASGQARLTGLPVGVDLEVIVTVAGMAAPARTVKLPAAGGRQEQVAVTWKPLGQGQARFTGVVGGPERAYLVRAHLVVPSSQASSACLSAPFQLPASRGAAVTVLVFPRIIFGFSLESWIDDVYLGVRGQFSLRNSSLAPYLAGTIQKREDLVIPLPVGFTGATVRQDFAEEIGVDPTRGLIIRNPVPPGGLGFIAAFSLKTDDGQLRWDMELPFGALESDLALRRTPTMELDLPPRTSVREVTDSGNKWYAIGPISVQPRQRMVFTLTGLPSPPAWARYARIGVGLTVLVLLVGAVVLALLRGRGAPEPSRSRYDQLVDELAAMADSTDPADARKRERLMAELESLHRARGAAKAAR